MIRLAVFTDAHYARGAHFLGTRMSGQSIEKLKGIFSELPPIDALINLGDLINATGKPQEDATNIADMLGFLSSCGAPCYGVLGNHDCEAARKSAFPHAGAYAFSLGGVNFIAPDANFISTGESYDDTAWDWTDALIPPSQLEWLEQVLGEALKDVIVLCHQNLNDTQGNPHVIGNADQVRRLLEASGKVRSVLQGHDHRGGFEEINGIPYYTFRALCEGDTAPYALVEIENGRVSVCEKDDSVKDVLRVSGVVSDSIVDGPGLRLTVFTQGCPHKCPGCHNPQTHDFTGGHDMRVSDILSRVDGNVLLSGVTLSGGEPFCQAAACALIARKCHEKGLNVWTYTGYTFEALLDGLDAHPSWRDLLAESDVLVDGPFIMAEKSLDCLWRGSKNQRVLNARASLEAGHAIEAEL